MADGLRTTVARPWPKCRLAVFPQHVQHAMKACVWVGEKAFALKLFESATDLVAMLSTTDDVSNEKQIDLDVHVKRCVRE